MEKPESAEYPEKTYWQPGQRFISGKNPVFPGKEDPGLCFFPAVRFVVYTARTIGLPIQRWEWRSVKNVWEKFFWNCRKRRS